MKYSPDSSSLKVDIKMYKGEMFIHFHDTGYGMSEEGLEKSMHEYEVAHDKNDINVKSIGLGLPLIRNLLELMGIRFFIDSKLGRGTKITIVIPKNKIKSKRK
nr:ATP-binding protein [Alphaproteobacteria bacterium]